MEWSKKAPGVWTTSVGAPEALTPFSVMNPAPRLDALQELGDAPPALDLKDIAIDKIGTRTVIRLPLGPEEGLFGLGLQFMRVNHRGYTRFLRVNSDPRQDTGETHAPVPFYVSSRGYGVLVDTARIVTIYCGSTVRKDSAHPPVLRDRGRDNAWEATPLSDAVEIVFTGPGANVFVFTGPAPLEVVRRYNLFCGGGTLPPRWGLGFWHRVHYWHDEAKAVAEVRQFRERGYPCDVLGLEPGWHSKSYPTTCEWGKDRFPKPAEFVAQMAKDGFRVNLWENPWLSPDARIYPKLAPLAGTHTVWGGLAVDYSLPEARQILQQQHDADHVAIGISGYKLDECDGSELTGASWMFPAHAKFPSGNDGEQMRQVYALLLMKATAEIFHKHDRRTYGLVRAATAGASPLPYVLYSDLYDHREFIRALCNSGFSGLLWTPEIRGADSEEEWVRRMQSLCFSPLMMLNAWGMSIFPWSFPKVEPIIRKYVNLRMQLLPYFYSAFARYCFDGTPPFRAMALEPGIALRTQANPASAADLTVHAYGERAKLDIDDQYMAGDALLVAPLFTGQKSRKVVLPAGTDWHDFETGERHEGGRIIEVAPGLETIPVFVRAGGIVPLMPPLPHAPAAGEAVPLEVRHYGRTAGRFALFDDDGETFAYERGQYRWRNLAVEVKPDGSRQGTFDKSPKGWRSAYGEATFKYLG